MTTGCGVRTWRAWSDEELDFMRREFANASNASLAAALGRPVNPVANKGNQMGLRKSRERVLQSNRERADKAVREEAAKRFPLFAPRAAEGKLREGELGLEKLCTRCDEWWPADREFFFPAKAGVAGLFYCCKACYREWRVEHEAKQVAAISEGATHA